MSGDAAAGRDDGRRSTGADARRARRSSEAMSTRQIVKLVGTITGFIALTTLLTFLLSFVVFLVAS